jgi:hypothetical protein
MQARKAAGLAPIESIVKNQTWNARELIPHGEGEKGLFLN